MARSMSRTVSGRGQQVFAPKSASAFRSSVAESSEIVEAWTCGMVSSFKRFSHPKFLISCRFLSRTSFVSHPHEVPSFPDCTPSGVESPSLCKSGVSIGKKRVLAQSMLQKILEAQMDNYLQAPRYERSDALTGSRNGHYDSKLTTRVGQLTLRVPRDRDGTFSTALFERYSRSERALVSTLVEMVVCGVNTRRVTKITQELCGKEFSNSTISRYTLELDELVDAWRNRVAEQDFPFLLVDAIHLKVRQDTRVETRALMLAVGAISRT